MKDGLRADVFVSPSKQVAPEAVTGRVAMWSPTTATLITGRHDAVLVDALMTDAEVEMLGDWIASYNKRLTTIYVTHGHGDHFFGIGRLLKRFPEARAVATEATVRYMQSQRMPPVFEDFWEKRFPGQISRPLVAADVLRENAIDLEGHELIPVEVGQSDTHDTTVLHVPDLDLVVAGDVAYNDVHLYLTESTKERRRDWIASIARVADLHPRLVVAGHKRPGAVDGAYILDETKKYIEDFQEMLEQAPDAESLVKAMLRAYPARINPDPLRNSVRAIFAAGKDL